MADEYTQVNSRGELVGKQQILASFQSGKRYWQEAESDQYQIRVYGDVAVVFGRWRAKGVNSGQAFNYAARYVSVWVYRDGRWQMVSDQSTEIPDFHLDDPDYLVSRLQPIHLEPLQRLFEQCADYAMIVDGEGVSPFAAQDTFEDAPAGKSLDDKFLYGLFDRAGNLLGVLEGIHHYPDEATWWIGLLMLSPDVRGRGLGRQLVEAFSEYARSQQASSIMLGVVEDNHAAYRFWQEMRFELVRQTEPRPFGKKMQTVYVMRRGMA